MPPLMLAVVVLAFVFCTCAWSGRMLARHYQDGIEVAAVAAIGACMLASVRMAAAVGAAHTPLLLSGVALAGGGGLLTGYLTSERAR